MTDLTRDTIVPFLAEIFAKGASQEYLGEPVTIGEHMLQSAALAEDAGAAETTIAAALLHDIGHFTHDFPADAAQQGIDSQHEEAGAQILTRFFPSLVVDCVRHHVDAKRYLCATRPDYFERLSEASVLSLKLQGGPMSDAEASAFAKNPNLEQIIQVRFMDEAAKIPGKPTPNFAYYAPLLQRVVDTHLGTPA